MEGDGHGKRASSSAVQFRLSPLAQPFSSNRFAATAQPSWPSLTSTDSCASVLEPLCDFDLEDLLDFGDDTLFPEYPSANAGSESGFMPSGSASSFSSNKNASSAYEDLVEQGSKPYAEHSSQSVHEKLSNLTIGRENQFTPSPTDQNRSPSHNAFPAMVLESPDVRTTVSPLNAVTSKNLDLKGNFALKTYDSSFKFSPFGIKDCYNLPSAEGKEIHHDESPNDKGKEGKDRKPFSREGIGRLVTAKSEEAASLLKKWDDSDSDLDSPCWKGTLDSRQSPVGVSRCLSSDFVENAQESRNSLNPLAPHYFPRHPNSAVTYHTIDCSGDVLSSFQKSESSAVTKGIIPVDQAVSKSPLLVNGIGTKSSSDIHDLERDYVHLNNSENGSVLKSAEGLSDLLSSDSKKDVSTVLSTMHDLSQWLLQNCSDDLDSFNEHEHDVIQDLMNNLSMCIQHRTGGKIPISEITLTGTPFCPNKSSELHECSSTGFQLAMTKAAVPHHLDYQNGHQGAKVNPHVFTERMFDSFPSCSSIGTEQSNSIIQVMGNTLRDNHLTKEELDPQALVYKKLWLEAEAALRSMKYETYALCMKLEMGGYKFDEN